MTTKTVSEVRKLGVQHRFVTVDRSAVDEEKRTAQIAFSTETPVERYWGTEILDHSAGAVRLGRLNDGGAVLMEHDTRQKVGIVEKAEIGADKVGRAVVRFGRSARAEEAFRDVLDGINRHISVGYRIHAMTLQEKKDDAETFRITDWEPMEVSWVGIPADVNAGVGRSAPSDESFDCIVQRTVEVEPQPTRAGAEPEPQAAASKPQPSGVIIMADGQDPRPGDVVERERSATIIALGEQYKKYIQERDVQDAITKGASIEAFKETIMARMESKYSDPAVAALNLTAMEVQRYSLGRALVASLTGDWSKAGFERDCSLALAQRVGKSAEGFYVPPDYWKRDFNVGTTTEAGNLVPTDLRPDLYVDALRNAMVLGALGVRFMPGLTSNIDIPRKSAVSSIGTLTEIGSASETNPNIAKVSLSPKRMGAYVEVSKQALIQSAMAIEGLIRDDLVTGAANQMEGLCLNGNGTSPQYTGVRNTTGIGTVVAGTAGAAPAWSHFVDLESAVANANAEPDRLAGYVVNTKTRGKAKQTQKGTNFPAWIWDNGAQPLNGYRALVTNNLPANLTKGSNTTVCSAALFASDWSMAILGLFGPPDVTVDPYTLAATGQVRITLNQFADFGIRQPAAFAKIDDLLS